MAAVWRCLACDRKGWHISIERNNAAKLFFVHVMRLHMYDGREAFSLQWVANNQEASVEVAPDVLLQNPHQRGLVRDQEASAQFLTMRLGTEEYAMDILRVQEIRSYEQPVRMVQSPSFVKGVINLRGVIVPIVDLRLKLQLSQAEYNDSTVVIILWLQTGVMGAVVDGVSDVVSLTSSLIKPAPHFESQLDPGCIVGLAQLGERMLVVVNINRLMAYSGGGVEAAA